MARKQTTGACTEARDQLSIHQRRQDIEARGQKARENEDKGVNGDHVGDKDVSGLGCHYVEAEDGGDTAAERRASRYDIATGPEGEPEENLGDGFAVVRSAEMLGPPRQNWRIHLSCRM